MYISPGVSPLVCLYCIPLSVTCPSPLIFFCDQTDLADHVLRITRKHQRADAEHADINLTVFFYRLQNCRVCPYYREPRDVDKAGLV